MKTRIRKNDIVQVIGGRDSGRRTAQGSEQEKLRGRRGRVLSVDRERNRALVQGVQMVYKHERASRDPNRPGGGRIEKEAPIHLSDLMVVCPACDAATRIGVREEAHDRPDGRSKVQRIRVCRKCGADIPERS